MGTTSVQLALRHPIRKSDRWEGKLHNLKLAATRIDGVVIEPGRLFSFWALVGKPEVSNGFTVGRSIRSDQITADVGGGLCQLSGLIYELALKGGLQIAERFPHTQDLYTEETRFTPLGMDATVVWGHKDLRFRNVTSRPLFFAFDVSSDWIEGCIRAPAPLSIMKIMIERTDASARHRCVTVRRDHADGRSEMISRDRYYVADASQI